MRSHAQYCPVAKAAEAIGDRWTLLIVRELLNGASRFNELERGLPGISRSILAGRLRGLEAAGIVERTAGPERRTGGYRLTGAGRELDPVFQLLGEWAVRWILSDPRPEELD
ncbi:MAG TPA: helix-turn-helix domain-containing protein, partial [Candidatus Limnocylindrales bacterium]|nr:helix-turn-helix domain-containing protein [Candidatus Limnocylindrales bacterium]